MSGGTFVGKAAAAFVANSVERLSPTLQEWLWPTMSARVSPTLQGMGGYPAIPAPRAL